MVLGPKGRLGIGERLGRPGPGGEALTDFIVIEGLLAGLGAGAVEPSLEVGQEVLFVEHRATSHVVSTNSTDPGVDFLKKRIIFIVLNF